MSLVIMIAYYLMTAFFAVFIVVNFAKEKSAQKAILYLVVLVPFVMRLFRLK